MLPILKRYYDINKKLLFIIGGWPTQNIFIRILMPTIIACLMFSIGFLEFIKVTENWKAITQDCECLILLILTIGAYFKLSSIVLNTKKINRLLSLVDYHWHIFMHSVEVQVMHDYAVVERKITIFLIAIFYTLLSLFMLIPVIPKLLNIVKPLNKSRPNNYLFDVDYSFDRDEYYYVVILHSYLVSVGGISMLLSVDTFYVMLTQHVCSLFAAIGLRLENLNLEISSWKDSELEETHEYGLVDCIKHDRDEKIYREIIVILWKHQLSIEFVSLLNSSFGFYSFILMVFNMAVISLILIQMIVLMDRKGDLIRFLAMGIASFIHLFILSFPGQRIIDHSSDVFDKAYNVLWYKLSRKSTQLLSILLYRCLTPCTLTVGKMYVLSLVNYASMVQTSFSYFTALSSFS